MVIAIDGPAGAGKSTVAQALAERGVKQSGLLMSEKQGDKETRDGGRQFLKVRNSSMA